MSYLVKNASMEIVAAIIAVDTSTVVVNITTAIAVAAPYQS